MTSRYDIGNIPYTDELSGIHRGRLAGLSWEKRTAAVDDHVTELAESYHAFGECSCEGACDSADCDCECAGEWDEDDWGEFECDWDAKPSPEEAAAYRVKQASGLCLHCSPFERYAEMYEPTPNKQGTYVLRRSVKEAMQSGEITSLWWDEQMKKSLYAYSFTGALLPHEEDIAYFLAFTLKTCDEDTQSFVYELLAAGGSMTFTDEEVADGALQKRFITMPFGVFFHHEGVFTAVLWEELRPFVAALDLDRIAEAREHNKNALLMIRAMAYLSGVVVPEDAYEQYGLWYDEEDYESADDLWYSVLSFSQNVPYLAPELFVAGEEDLDCGPVAFCHDLTEFVRAREGQEEYGSSMSRADLRKLERAMDDMLFDLQEQHRQVGFAPLPDELKGRNAEDWLMSLPESRAILAFIDKRIPDGEDDYLFAGNYLADLLMFWRSDADEIAVMSALMEDHGVVYGADDMKRLTELHLALSAVMPKWANNGLSANALKERQNECRVFRAEGGKVTKIGRNDPCPCGSGKKYKKCCGAGC